MKLSKSRSIITLCSLLVTGTAIPLILPTHTIFRPEINSRIPAEKQTVVARTLRKNPVPQALPDDESYRQDLEQLVATGSATRNDFRNLSLCYLDDPDELKWEQFISRYVMEMGSYYDPAALYPERSIFFIEKELSSANQLSPRALAFLKIIVFPEIMDYSPGRLWENETPQEILALYWAKRSWQDREYAATSEKSFPISAKSEKHLAKAVRYDPNCYLARYFKLRKIVGELTISYFKKEKAKARELKEVALPIYQNLVAEGLSSTLWRFLAWQIRDQYDDVLLPPRQAREDGTGNTRRILDEKKQLSRAIEEARLESDDRVRKLLEEKQEEYRRQYPTQE